jgi:hypothetical protein
MPILEDIVDKLKNRPTILLKKPILSTVLGSIIVAGTVYDGEVEKMKEEKIREWREKGVSEGMINYAIKLAEEWTAKMVEWSTRYIPPEEKEKVQKMMVAPMFKKGLEVAEDWIKAFKTQLFTE